MRDALEKLKALLYIDPRVEHLGTIDITHGGYGEVLAFPCCVSPKVIDETAAQYDIPFWYTCWPGVPEERVYSARVAKPMFCAIYTEQFKAGLRLPLHPFIRQVLRFYRISLAQVVPNGIRNLVGFMSLLKRNNKEQTLAHFHRFFRMQAARGSDGWFTFLAKKSSKVITRLPESNRAWKPNWFTVEAPWLDWDVEWNNHPNQKCNLMKKREYYQADKDWARDLIQEIVTKEAIVRYQLKGE